MLWSFRTSSMCKWRDLIIYCLVRLRRIAKTESALKLLRARSFTRNACIRFKQKAYLWSQTINYLVAFFLRSTPEITKIYDSNSQLLNSRCSYELVVHSSAVEYSLAYFLHSWIFLHFWTLWSAEQETISHGWKRTPFCMILHLKCVSGQIFATVLSPKYMPR